MHVFLIAENGSIWLEFVSRNLDLSKRSSLKYLTKRSKIMSILVQKALLDVSRNVEKWIASTKYNTFA